VLPLSKVICGAGVAGNLSRGVLERRLRPKFTIS
jgi:hypothetical protein